jgi:hypothetical protein
MNALPPRIKRGTLGELLAQVYLLEYGVQAAPPLRDSGNDLIACRGESIFALQVKTKKKYNFSKGQLPELYHGAVFIVLKEKKGRCDISNPDIYLMTRAEIESASGLGKMAIKPFRISSQRIDSFFGIEVRHGPIRTPPASGVRATHAPAAKSFWQQPPKHGRRRTTPRAQTRHKRHEPPVA